jgi:aryl-alcohol dehydrogenase-like predicted oxidoreductase
MGGWDYGSVNDHESIAAVHAALDVGVNFFDTADVYGFGHSEKVLRKALGTSCGDVIVATKFGLNWDDQGRTTRDSSPKRVVEALESSLRRLKLDCIPLYQIHWPDPTTPIADTLEALDRCKTEGKIQHIGCCNFSRELIETAQAISRLESLQVPYSLGQREFEDVMVMSAEQFGMGVLCYNALAQGLFVGKFTRESVFEDDDLRSRSVLFQGEKLESNLATLNRLQAVANKCEKTSGQVAIRWVLENKSVTSALTGIRTAAQALENIGGSGWSLDASTYDFLLPPNLLDQGPRKSGDN